MIDEKYKIYEDTLYVITKNAAQCKKCNDVIESKHRHDFVTCSCGEISVDGGLSYLRRLANDPDNIISLSEHRKLTLEELNEKISIMESRGNDKYLVDPIKATKYYRDLWYPPRDDLTE